MRDVMEELFPDGLEPLLQAMAQRFAAEWAERAVELLMAARGALLPVRSHPRLGELYCLSLSVPPRLYARAAGQRDQLERDLLSCARGLLPPVLRERLDSVSLGPLLVADGDWRERAQRWLRGTAAAPRPGPTLEPAPAAWRAVEVQLRAQRPEPVPPLPSPLGRPAAAPPEEEPPPEERYRWIRIR